MNQPFQGHEPRDLPLIYATIAEEELEPTTLSLAYETNVIPLNYYDIFIGTMGLEPITNNGADFKSAVYTIPPSAISRK